MDLYMILSLNRKHIFNRNSSICPLQRAVSWSYSIPVLWCSADTAAPNSTVDTCQSSGPKGADSWHQTIRWEISGALHDEIFFLKWQITLISPYLRNFWELFQKSKRRRWLLDKQKCFASYCIKFDRSATQCFFVSIMFIYVIYDALRKA